MSAAQSAPLRTMIARVSIDDVIIYANDALAAYLRDARNEPDRLIFRGSFAASAVARSPECFAVPHPAAPATVWFRDGDGRIFEAQVYASGGTLDIVLDEIGTPGLATSELRESSGTPLGTAQRGGTANGPPSGAKIS